MDCALDFIKISLAAELRYFSPGSIPAYGHLLRIDSVPTLNFCAKKLNKQTKKSVLTGACIRN
jgi:hypothetical protein